MIVIQSLDLTDIATFHLFFLIIISKRNFGGVDEMLIQILPTSMIEGDTSTSIFLNNKILNRMTNVIDCSHLD